MASGEEPGWFRLEVADALGNNRTTVFQGHVDPANTSATAVQTNNQLIPPCHHVVADSDMRLNFSFIAELAAGDILESEESDLAIPYTTIRKSDGQVFEGFLSLEQMTGFKPSGTVDIQVSGGTGISGSFTVLCYFEVPEGYRAHWGHKTLQTSHCYVYLGDDA